MVCCAPLAQPQHLSISPHPCAAACCSAGGVTFDAANAFYENGTPQGPGNISWSGLTAQSKLTQAAQQGLWIKCNNQTDMSPLSTISGNKAAVFAGTDANSTNATATIASDYAERTLLELQGLFAVSVKVRMQWLCWLIPQPACDRRRCCCRPARLTAASPCARPTQLLDAPSLSVPHTHVPPRCRPRRTTPPWKSQPSTPPALSLALTQHPSRRQHWLLSTPLAWPASSRPPASSLLRSLASASAETMSLQSWSLTTC